jgi:hypothetical protein
MMSIPLHVSRALHAHFGEPIARIFPAQHGFTAAIRCVVALESGKRFFLKCATDLETQTWLRMERKMYSYFAEMRAETTTTFAPHLLLWIEGDDSRAFDAMALEDLSACEATPPWRNAHIQSVLATLNSLHSLAPPNDLPRLAEAIHFTHAWKQIAAAPADAIALSIIDPVWWARHGEALAALDGARILSGHALLHFDVRSDNMRFRKGACVLFDWNWACVGDARADGAAWLASLVMEGGALPQALVRESRDQILLFMGFCCTVHPTRHSKSAKTTRVSAQASARVEAYCGRIAGLNLRNTCGADLSLFRQILPKKRPKKNAPRVGTPKYAL